MATPKQTNYIMYLLDAAGYDTRWMDKSYRALGAKMSQRSGKVENWVSSLNTAEASNVIQTLKEAVD